MGFAAAMFRQPVLQVQLKQQQMQRRGKSPIAPIARLFGRSVFEASKLKVLFLGEEEEKQPGKLPRTYTLTHSDVTSTITLAISRTVNHAQLQGWYNRLQRDEVVAEWEEVQGRRSLHVHCHVSCGHALLGLIAGLRSRIFRRELPVVLKAFVHGDGELFGSHPELEEATVWVYFHSDLPEFNRVECWGLLKDAASSGPPSSPQPPAASDRRRNGGVRVLLPSAEFDHEAVFDLFGLSKSKLI